MKEIEKLNKVLDYVKHSFIGKDEVVDLLGICLVARENAFLLGPPGTAKSAIVRLLSTCIEGGKNFEYLLTRFTEPNEIFGPFDIRKLKEGELITNTEGMMPEASMIFLDEIFNANSAILNSLLLALNERTFRRGKELRKLPALMFVGASNILPEDEALNALLDRFLIRVRCGYVDTDLLGDVLNKGWILENNEEAKRPTIDPDEIRKLQAERRSISLSKISEAYVDAIHNLRNAGIKVSDRRAVKVQNLLAASALMSGRKEAELSDLWVLRYIWDTEEQMELLSGIVDKIIEKDETEKRHPQAYATQIPDAEELAKDVKILEEKWEDKNLTFEEQNVIKDKLRFLQNRSNWVKKDEHKKHLQEKIDALWEKMLQTL